MSNTSAQLTGSVWPRRLAQTALVLAWTVNIALLVAGFLWVFGSGRSMRTIELLHSQFDLEDAGSSITIRDPSRLGWEVTLAKSGVVLAAGTLLVMFASLFIGTSRFRTARLWLVFTGLVCGWLGLLTTWQDIYWLGQQFRIKSDLAPIAALAQELQQNWPVEDGEYPKLGMFLAYPKGAPRTMLLLGDATFSNSSLEVSAIERTADGAIRFELSGNERGAWLEWRANDTPPEPFIGGLETGYKVARYQRLAPQWFLVRYRSEAGRSG